jgi:hypothetical protein
MDRGENSYSGQIGLVRHYTHKRRREQPKEAQIEDRPGHLKLFTDERGRLYSGGLRCRYEAPENIQDGFNGSGA